MKLSKYLFKDTNQILLFFFVAAICYSFVELAAFVTSGGTASMDTAVVLYFREAADLTDPIGPKWVEEMMRDITALGGVGMLVLVTLTVFGFLLIKGDNKVAMVILVGIATGMAVSFSLKYGFSRPRPDLVPHGSYVYTSSFPSGHAMMSALVYLTLAGLVTQRIQLAKRLKTYIFSVAILLTISIGISRIYLGVHWPSDVLAGWLVGSGWALITYYAYRILRFRELNAS